MRLCNIQGLAKRWALGYSNSPPAARRSQEAGFTQPRYHLLANTCTLYYYNGKPAIRLSHVPSNRKPTQTPLLVTGKAIVQITQAQSRDALNTKRRTNESRTHFDLVLSC